jgi:murein DD-endopeptidase MepM/ murein hydrolase activator NlpD
MLALACPDAAETPAPPGGEAPAATPSVAEPPQDPAPPEVVEAPPRPAPVTEPEPPDPLAGAVAPGDSLSKILHRAGLDARAIHESTTALAEVTEPAALRVGQRFEIDLADDGSLAQLVLHVDAIARIVVRRDAEGRLAAVREEVPTTTDEATVGAVVTSSLWAAVTGAGEHASLVSFLVDVFAYDIDFFTDTRAGDQFRMIVEKVSVDGEFVEYGRVLAAEYAGAVGTFRVFWFEPRRGEPRWVDDEGLGVARTLLKTPLKYSRVSSEFDPKRMHPILHREKGHNGVDYAAPEGTPVWAAAPGRITFRGERKGAGNMVILAHAGGMTTLYMHLSRFAAGHRVGMAVAAKTVIGYVGQTGLATGPHLHFGLKIGGRYVDPQAVDRHRGPGVPTGDRARWKRQRAALVDRLDAISLPAPTTGL